MQHEGANRVSMHALRGRWPFEYHVPAQGPVTFSSTVLQVHDDQD